MSKSDSFENKLMLLLFNNANIANVGDSGGISGSVATGSFYVSLHTADPGEAGSQNTTEVGYGAYLRTAVARNANGWTVTSNQAVNAATVSLPACGSSQATATYFGVGTVQSGAGLLLYSGALTTPLGITAGVTPAFSAGALTISED